MAEIRRTSGPLAYKLGNSQNNDVVILKLKEAISNSKAKPACLPDANDNPSVGETLYVSGWGTTSSGNSFSIFFLKNPFRG